MLVVSRKPPCTQTAVHIYFYLLVRAELGSFWRLLLAAEEGRLASRVSRHQLLYPNPYPKPGQRGKRWAGHPALPIALQLGSAVEVRSNWLPYCLEFREEWTGEDVSGDMRSHDPYTLIFHHAFLELGVERGNCLRFSFVCLSLFLLLFGGMGVMRIGFPTSPRG